MTKVIIAFSGGMDSTTVLAEALASGREIVRAISFNYGSKHGPYEQMAARKICMHYKIFHMVIDIRAAMSGITSSLLQGGGNIPEGHYNEESMSQTVVPGRNMIFASILAGYAQSMKVDEVWLGVHAGDHAIYPDCRQEFIVCMDSAIRLATEEAVCLEAPFLELDKADILRRGYELDVPYHLTRTCYKDQPVACGKCGSCQERLEAFAQIDKEDPIQYETRELVPKSSS